MKFDFGEQGKMPIFQENKGTGTFPCEGLIFLIYFFQGTGFDISCNYRQFHEMSKPVFR